MPRKLTGSETRQKFLDFFAAKGHAKVHSSSLVPANDPTLLFTNAGMNQFKDVFLGLEKRSYNRATTSQKCVRAGGKHNDLENVGFTNRHHTFFEMLGNFSFGDYFKKDAIAYAWELITSPEWFGIEPDKLYVTIFEGDGVVGRDDEAEKHWIAVGVPKERIFAMGAKDNFWAMGDTGPCGPCSEMHYDMGVKASDAGHTDCKFPCDCGRYVEIWNLVFMQFDRDASGKLTPLPKPSIDTGAGLERVAAVLQGVISNYETDLFTPLIARAASLTGVNLQKELKAEKHTRSAGSLRVIADHARAATFLISDGVLPANEGRGYVLRKILRRGIRHGRLLGQDRPFMSSMVYAVRDAMKDAYPELVESTERVVKVVFAEESRFAKVVGIALAKMEEKFSEARTQPLKNVEELLSSYEREAGQDSALSFTKLERIRQDIEANPQEKDSIIEKEILSIHPKEVRPILRESIQNLNLFSTKPFFDGKVAFDLYETFGLPRDFMEDAARDANIEFDAEGFESALRNERDRARASWKGGSKVSASPAYREVPKTVFEGYTQTESDGCEVLAIVHNSLGVQELKAGQPGEIVLDHTPFYADSGGQVGDIGVFYNDEHNTIVAEVNGCVMPVQGVRAHKVVAKHDIRVGDRIDAVVHADVRQATIRNHTGTHLLHAALRETLGKHVKQAGSLVDPKHLRFDFSHFTGVADEEMQDIEDLVNKEVLRNTKVETIADVPIDVAINEYKAMALFGEKYGDTVRVVKIGDFSTELCGGIHTAATGEIGLVKLLHEASVSSGVRRVEAITGEGSLRHFRTDHRVVGIANQILGTQASTTENGDPAEAIKRALLDKDEEIKRLRKELDQARMKSASASVSAAQDQVKTVNGVKVLAQRVDNLERTQMRTLVDSLRNKLGSGVVVLGSVIETESDGENGAKIKEKKVALVVGVTKDLTARIQAGKIISPIAQRVGGSGGGRPDMAEAGGKNPAALDEALAAVPGVVEGLLK